MKINSLEEFEKHIELLSNFVTSWELLLLSYQRLNDFSGQLINEAMPIRWKNMQNLMSSQHIPSESILRDYCALRDGLASAKHLISISELHVETGNMLPEGDVK